MGKRATAPGDDAAGSASSSGAKDGKYLDPASPCPGKRTKYEKVSFVGNVALDRVPGGFAITHIVTQEQLIEKDTVDAQMEFDEETGDAIVFLGVDGGPDRELLLSEAFHTILKTDEDGFLYMTYSGENFFG